VLGQTTGSSDGPTPFGSRGGDLDEDLDAFVRQAVDPHRVREDPRQAADLGELDLRIARELRKILHDPAFLELESLWRSVVFLLSRIQVTTRLRVYLIDVSEAELMGDLLSSDDPTEWGFAHTVLDPVSEDGESLRWAALVGAYRFGSDPLHVPLLQRIGLLAESGRVPWISCADGAFLGCPDSLAANPDPRDWTSPVDPLWAELRGKPEAEWIHLVLPGFLLRSPYGPDGTPTKRFAFQEDPAFPDDLPWGNPAVLMGMALARRFADSGWGMQASGRHEVADLPLVPAPDGHQTCLQTRVSHTAASEVRNRGLIPVLTPRGEPRVFLEGIRSISTSDTALRAWWNA
jgi:type VI secretion system protein ImpC